MLDSLRRASKSIWARALLFVFLVPAFAIVGVDYAFRDVGANSVARVGPVEVPAQDFQEQLRQQLAQAQQQLQMFGRRASAEDLKIITTMTRSRVLSQMMDLAALEAHAQTLGLSLHPSLVADAVTQSPQLARYIRQDRLNLFTVLALTSGTQVPQTLVDALHRYEEETRKVEFFALDADKAVTVPEPDDAKLKTYYDTNKAQFMTPEFRKIGLLQISVDELKKAVQVTDADVKAAYDADKESYDTPEKRKFQKLWFPDKAAAEKAAATLAAATDFAAAAKALGFKDGDLDVTGPVALKDIVDAKLAAGVFKAEKDKVSAPIEGDFAIALVRVSEIEAAKHPTFDDVKGKVRDKLVATAVEDEIRKLVGKIDTSRSRGAPLKEIAEQLKLKFLTVDGTDRQGKTADGKPALELPGAAQVVSAAFDAAVGVEADPVELTDGSVIYFDLAGVKAAEQKPFDLVKDDAKRLWTAAERTKALRDAAAKLAERITKGETLEAVAKELGAKVETPAPLKRAAQASGLSRAAIQQAFLLGKDGVGQAELADGKTRTVFRVVEATLPAAPTKEQTEKLKQALVAGLKQDELQSYVAALRARFGVSINEPLVRRLTGEDTTTP